MLNLTVVMDENGLLALEQYNLHQIRRMAESYRIMGESGYRIPEGLEMTFPRAVDSQGLIYSNINILVTAIYVFNGRIVVSNGNIHIALDRVIEQFEGFLGK